MKANSRTRIEALENRIAPAGIVTIDYNPATGELILTGDDLGNSIQVGAIGANQHRIFAFSGTMLGPALTTYVDIGKLTKLTFVGGDGQDTFSIFNVSTLTSLSLDAGPGGGVMGATNLAVKGSVTVNGGAGDDTFNFDGLFTTIGGNLVVNDSGGLAQLNIGADKTVIKGSLLFAGSSGTNQMTNFNGSLAIGKGLQFNAGAGTGEFLLSGGGGMTIGKLPTGESILFTGGPGIDYIEIDEGTTTLAGGIRMTGSGDNDRLEIADRTAALKIGKLATGQSILFDGGTGDDTLSIAGSKVIAAGGFEVLAGDGSNTFDLGQGGGGMTIGKLLSGQSVKYTGGVNADTLNIRASALVLAGSLDFTGSDGANSLTIENANGTTKIGKGPNGASIRLVGGVNSNVFAAESANLALAGGFDFASTGTNSTATFSGINGRLAIGKLTSGHSVRFSGATGVSSFDANVEAFVASGGVEFTAGNGINAFALLGLEGAVSIGKLPTGESIRYTGAPGVDDIEITASVVKLGGGVEFAGSDGDNSVVFDASSFHSRSIKLGALPTGLSVNYTGGAGEDALTFGGSVVAKGSLEMNGGSGLNTLTVRGNQGVVGKSLAGASVRMLGGGGVDRVRLDGPLTFAGDVFHDGGSGNDRLEFFNFAKVGGGVTFLGGSGSNTFTASGSFFSVNKTLTITGADGGDAVSINADGFIGGNVDIDLGTSSAGVQSVSIGSRTFRASALTFKQGLSIASATTAPVLDSVLLSNAVVLGALTIDMGEGDSTVGIENLTAREGLNLMTDGGADTVTIERTVLPGNSVIAKLAVIQLGAGDDSLLIGSPEFAPNSGVADTTRVRFLGGLTADGGDGSDTVNAIETENDFPSSAPTVSNFELTAI